MSVQCGDKQVFLPPVVLQLVPPSSLPQTMANSWSRASIDTLKVLTLTLPYLSLQEHLEI